MGRLERLSDAVGATCIWAIPPYIPGACRDERTPSVAGYRSALAAEKPGGGDLT